MVMDHTKTTAKLTDEANSDNITIHFAMDSSRQKMFDKMNSLRGDDFRKQYFSDQVSAHKDAVSLFTRYGKGGDNAKLKDWALTDLRHLRPECRAQIVEMIGSGAADLRKRGAT
jgi:putative membrane protein